MPNSSVEMAGRQQAHIQRVPFEGGPMEAIRQDDRGWLILKTVCDFLGIDSGAQRKRLDRAPWAKSQTSIMDVWEGNLRRQVYCVRIDRVAMWLATIDSSRIADSKARSRIEEYQCNAADALDRWWRGEETPLSAAAQSPLHAVAAKQRGYWVDEPEIAVFLHMSRDVFRRKTEEFPKLSMLAKDGRWPIYEVSEFYKALTSGNSPEYGWGDVLQGLFDIATKKGIESFTPSEILREAQTNLLVHSGLDACFPHFRGLPREATVADLLKANDGRVVSNLRIIRIDAKRWAVVDAQRTYVGHRTYEAVPAQPQLDPLAIDAAPTKKLLS